MPLEITTKSAKGATELAVTVGGVVTEQKSKFEEKPEPIEAEPMAHIGVKLGGTINMGDYNSAKFEVSLHIPVPIDPSQPFALIRKELDKAFAEGLAWCDEQTSDLQQQVKKHPDYKG